MSHAAKNPMLEVPLFNDDCDLSGWPGYKAYVAQCDNSDKIWELDLKNPYGEVDRFKR